MNYFIPSVSTNRGKTSIKYNGPSTWYGVPRELKEIALRKPFAKKLKEHILADIFEDLPSSYTNQVSERNNIGFEQLRALFETEDEDIEFLGFPSENQNRNLEDLFMSDNENSEFLGFVSENQNRNLEDLFMSDNDTSEFFGF